MTEKKKKILLSGIKPTGRPHIGNYFGAMRQFVELQNEYESYFMIADYHALTDESLQKNPSQLTQNILDLALDYIAVGLDPKKITLFKQSAIPQHTELAWIFNCITTMPYLSRAHAFKDAQAKKKEINVGVFDYPLLQAADILIYDTETAPVGQDQKQHIEYARDTAEKFNHIYGETFTLPDEHILEDVAIIPGTDGRKMSKSYNNTIPLFAEDDEIKKQTMAIVTDSKEEHEQKDPTTCNVFALHKLFSEDRLPEIKKRYIDGKIGYRESKEILVTNITNFITPLREKRNELTQNTNAMYEILKAGEKKAGEIAEAKMKEIRKKVGVSL